MDIHNPKDKHFNCVEFIGVAITCSTEGQNHIGILYNENINSPARILHLAWHYILIDEEPKNTYHWLDCGLDEINKAVLVAYCKEIIHVNGKDTIPYGIDITDKVFNPITGEWAPENENCGLTCSTFVMQVFSAQGHNILCKESWENRASDSRWQTNILNKLSENNISEKYIAKQKKNIGAFRFRPEEVAGSIPQCEYPVPFSKAVEFGEILVNQIS